MDLVIEPVKVYRVAKRDAMTIVQRIEDDILDGYRTFALEQAYIAAQDQSPGSWLPTMLAEYLAKNRQLTV